METDNLLTKVCNGCHQDLPRDMFYSRKNRGPNSIASRCKTCQISSASSWNKSNKDKIRSRYNPQQQAKASQRWIAKQPLGWRKKYDSRRDPHKEANRESRRRAHLLGNNTEKVDRRVVYKRDGGLCGICRESVPLETFQLDHIVAVVHGGEHNYANVQIAHSICNQRKNDSPIADWVIAI